MNRIVLEPSPALEFILSGGCSIIVPAATGAQFATVPELELESGEEADPTTLSAWRRRVIAHFIGSKVQRVETRGEERVETEEDTGRVLDRLTPQEEQRMIAALSVAATGGDPVTAVALHELLTLQAYLNTLPTRSAETPSPEHGNR
jgi:hypothetical protein